MEEELQEHDLSLQGLTANEQLETIRLLLRSLDPKTRSAIESHAEAFRASLRDGGNLAGMAFGLVGCEIAAGVKP